MNKLIIDEVEKSIVSAAKKLLEKTTLLNYEGSDTSKKANNRKKVLRIISEEAKYTIKIAMLTGYILSDSFLHKMKNSRQR